MGRGNRQEALAYLLQQAEKQGYVTFDNIIDCADSKSLPIQDFDWLTNVITTRGILVYEKEPETRTKSNQSDDDFDDFAQADYGAIFDRIVELDDSLKDLVKKVRAIVPPQWKELSTLKYQVVEGNRHARSRMIEMHLRIALKIALQRAESYDMDIADAIAEACIGLIIAVDKYDPDTNGAFGSYATMWIMQNISRYQNVRNALVYYPVHRKELYFVAYPILKSVGYLETLDLLERKKLEGLLQDRLNFDAKQAEDVLNAAIPFESLDQILSEDSQEDLSRLAKRKMNHITSSLTADDDVEQQALDALLREDLTAALNTLRPREKEVLVLRYGLYDNEERTLEEVGKYFNVTRERVRQIEGKAISKLGRLSQFKKLREYL